MQSVRIAWRNITRQKKRTALLGGAIAFGVLVIILIGSFTTGVLENVRDNFTGIFGGHIYISGEELSPTGRILGQIGDTEALEEALQSIEGEISSVQLRSRSRGDVIFASVRESIRIEGVDWNGESRLWEDLGIEEGERDLLYRENAIILPESVADSLGVQIGETVLFSMSSLTGQANVGEFVVAGVYPDNQAFNISGGYTGLPYLNSLLGLSSEEYQFLNVTLAGLEEIDQLADRLLDELALLAPVEIEDGAEEETNRGRMLAMFGGGFSTLAEDEEAWEGTRFSISTLNDMMEPVFTLVQILDLIRTGLFALLLIITMVGLLNTFRMILIERTQEIGTMRAIGMQRGGVRNIFLFEALFLALAGAVAGLVAAGLLMGILGNIPIGGESVLQLFTANGRFAFPFRVADVAATVLVLAGITVLSAFLPARKAAKLKPADALRANY
jgi:putative ABC transport system permease protein